MHQIAYFESPKSKNSLMWEGDIYPLPHSPPLSPHFAPSPAILHFQLEEGTYSVNVYLYSYSYFGLKIF